MKSTTQMPVRVPPANPHFKAWLQIFWDSCLIAAGLTILVIFLSNGVTWSVAHIAFLEILTYTVLITFLAHLVFNRMWFFVRDRRNAFQWAFFCTAMVAVSGVSSLVGSLIVLALRLEPQATLFFLFERSFTISAVVGLMIGVNQAMFARLRGQLIDTRLQLQKEELERERALKLATQAQLGSLESRLHPHFLFNTLNSISALIHSDPARAERMVERIASLLRFSLEPHETGLVSFDREIAIVRNYLEIETARFGDRLRWEIEAQGEFEGVKVPPLSIQTLVENSIKFAVSPNREGGKVRVSVSRADGDLRIDVADTGQGFLLDTVPAGHGLDNLRSRLAVVFGEAASLTVGHVAGWTTVTMKVPV